jgi:putative transposase
LVERWRTDRFPGDEAILAVLETWLDDPENKKGERHLYAWEVHLSDQVRAWRTDFYRRVFAELRRRYRVVVMENMDLREVLGTRRPKKYRQSVDETVAAKRRVAGVAAPALLRRIAKESGMELRMVDARNSTVECHACGVACEWPKQQLRHRCEHCGAEWDQDVNAAINLLRRGQRELSVAPPAEDLNKPGRTARLREAKQRRRAAESGEA